MRVGIGCFFQFSVFSNGQATTALSLAEALKTLGFDVSLINLNGERDWWDDTKSLATMFPVLKTDEVEKNPLDVFIDIDGYIISSERRKFAKKVVTFIRKPPVISEMEACVYPIFQPLRDLSGCDAIWHWDTHCPTDSRYLELLSRKPVFRVPYTWSPCLVEALARENKLPMWSQTTAQLSEDHPWEGHILETNTTMGSSCTIPLVILAHAKRFGGFTKIQKFAVHNADHIKENEFFKKNVLEHCQVADLEPIFVGRQRCVDWRQHPKSFALCHSRFNVVKGAVLDLAWNGIPVIHNSPWLKALGNGLERMYYEDNSVTGAIQAMKNMDEDFKAKSGIFAEGALVKIRTAMLLALNPKRNEGAWMNAMNFSASEVVAPIVTPVVAEKKEEEKVKEEKKENVQRPDERVLRIGFSDMWEDFNPSYNFFLLLLDTALRSVNKNVRVEGVDARTCSTANLDLLIFGPFGSFWESVPSSVPKVHFTGENTEPKKRDDVFLNLGYKATVDDDKGYIRLPLWMLEIDWFGANREKIVNPKPLPCDRCFQVFPEEEKSKFCAFVVTNPRNSLRNSAFQWLSAYKRVDSAGRLFNNVGSSIFAGGGGGGGELKKHMFLRDYKFCLSYENEESYGYTTEKWLHAKAAGCIPIYWGDPYVNRDFDSAGFLNAQDCKDPDSLIELVKSIDENPEAYEKMRRVPAVDEYRRDLVRRRFSELAKRLLEAGLKESIELPKFLGATSDAEAAKLRLEREGDVEPVVPLVGSGVENSSAINPINSPVLVTYATERFLPSLLHWLRTLLPQKQHNEALTLIGYLGPDIKEQTKKSLLEDYSFVDWRPVPTETYKVDGFPDFWEAQHFAWKIWIYNELVNEPALRGRLIWYFDAGCMLVRWPNKYLQKVCEEGICVLEDSRQKNEQWCHEAFLKSLNVTEEEKKGQQIVGGILAFLGGHPKAVRLFSEALKWAKVREVIAGPKWSGTLPDGRPFGHRHDQSILSVLSQRQGLARWPLDDVYCDESLRRTFKSGASLYCHRGQFRTHVNTLSRISEIHIINLKRREDRLKRFKENHSWKGSELWVPKVCVRPAVDGRALKMTPDIARLFAPNDFKWKKAILGCALSHLSLWQELANENNVMENYLILEDDVKFTPEWEGIWEEASKHIPDDYDVLYLGGVLPPNREVFRKVLSPVNDYWSVVAPNQIFGQREPSRYFHFCNYAYILRRSAAQKVLDSIKAHGGYFTSADHMICNQIENMKHYVLTPQVAGCYQDDDPKYQTSVFNDFNRVDAFDSDLWNNDERWTADDLNGLGAIPAEVNVTKALSDAYSVGPVVATPATTVEAKQEAPSIRPGRFFTLSPHKVVMEHFLEKKWLQDLMGPKAVMDFQMIDSSTDPLDCYPIFLVQRPHVSLYAEHFQKYEVARKPFAVLHLSDEYCGDDISFYTFEMCKAVVRAYPRADIQDFAKSKVITIPLGYAKHTPSSTDMAWVSTPSLPFRENIWSFHGTKWMNREEKLSVLKAFQPCSYKFFDNWLDAKQLKELEYSGCLLNTVFVPCPRGQHFETFRFWEALDHGAIPIVVREEGDETWFQMISSKLHMMNLPTWGHAGGLIQHLLNNKETLDKYRATLLVQWQRWKDELRIQVREAFAIKN